MEEIPFIQKILNDLGKNYKNTLIKKPIIIFLMGIPGTGKTFVVKKFIKNVLPLILYDSELLGEEKFLNENNFIYCNPDIIVKYIEGYSLEKNNDFIGRGTIYNNKLLKKLITDEKYYDKSYNLVYDATGSQYGHYLKHIDLAKQNGYFTILINVLSDINLAFERTQKRERKNDLEIIEKVFTNIYSKKSSKSKYPYLNNYEILNSKVDLHFEIDNNKDTIIKNSNILNFSIYREMSF